jgi:hypothetical protein
MSYTQCRSVENFKMFCNDLYIQQSIEYLPNLGIRLKKLTSHLYEVLPEDSHRTPQTYIQDDYKSCERLLTINICNRSHHL